MDTANRGVVPPVLTGPGVPCSRWRAFRIGAPKVWAIFSSSSFERIVKCPAKTLKSKSACAAKPRPTERGCVADQPQQCRAANGVRIFKRLRHFTVLRLAFSTAALRSRGLPFFPYSKIFRITRASVPWGRPSLAVRNSMRARAPCSAAYFFG